MKYNHDIHHRRSIRLKGYDYSQAGLYFITICTHNRENLFGEIVGANGICPEMVLNVYGEIVKNEWIKTTKIRSEIELYEFVVMPNHFHGIVEIRRGDRSAKGDQPVALTIKSGPQQKSIGSLIAGYKSVVTKQINILRNIPGVSVWQRNYYEHVIRDEKSYLKIAEYIINNPLHWLEDDYYNQ